MRKVVVRIGDKVIEFEISDDEVKALLGLESLKQEIVSFKQELEESHNSRITPQTKSGINQSQSRSSEDDESYKVIIQTHAEIRGRKEQSEYVLYRYNDGYLLGSVKSKSNISYVHLGNPSNPYSIISHIIKAVNTMPFHDSFTRRALRETLPSSLTRGNIIKFALDYMEYAGLIIKLKEKDIETGAIAYKRVSKMEDTSQKSGHDAASILLK